VWDTAGGVLGGRIALSRLWLTQRGWTIHSVSTNPELQASYGGTVREEDRKIGGTIHSQYITATR